MTWCQSESIGASVCGCVCPRCEHGVTLSQLRRSGDRSRSEGPHHHHPHHQGVVLQGPKVSRRQSKKDNKVLSGCCRTFLNESC